MAEKYITELEENNITYTLPYTDIEVNSSGTNTLSLDISQYPSPHSIILPSEYQQVEYIESTGTQYIDTGVVPNQYTSAYYHFRLTQILTGGQPLFGARVGKTENTRYLPFAFTSNIANVRTTFGDARVNFRRGSEVDFYGIFAPKDEISVINNTPYSLSNNNFAVTENNSIYIFAASGYGDILYNSQGQCFYLTIYQNENKIRDFIPCYRKFDNIIGMYDLVNNQFYTNQGTGTFIKGPDVN